MFFTIFIKKREAGFYWVKYNDEWIIGEYHQDFDEWTLSGSDSSYSDYAFDEIDEQRITRNRP